MTQLFDTNTYEDLDETGAPGDTNRHLRSMPTGDLTAQQLGERTTQWRLDERTIQVGRKGIQAARQALQDAARERSGDKPAQRKAA